MVARLRGIAALLIAAAAAAGCLLPWERVTVTVLGTAQSRAVSSFHGSGVGACAGAALAVLMLADQLLRPAPSSLRDAGRAFAGALLGVGAGLFTLDGGYAPGDHASTSVTLQPALYVAGGAGVALVISALLPAVGRRAGSRFRASSAEPARP